jgi:hypothetical protein
MALRLTVALATLATLATLGISIMAAPLLESFTVPNQPFSATTAPSPPNYALEENWAALPADEDKHPVDVFYLYPTSYLLGRNWNADTQNSLANFITDHGVLTQQASVFEDSANIYVPRYRQVSQGGQMQTTHPQQKRQALALAYGDLQRALEYYLQHFNQGRPFFIASHSQGTSHAIKLVPYLFSQHSDAARRLIAAYLVGNTVSESEMSQVLPVCNSAGAIGCFVSWNSVLRGGDASHWQAKGDPVCVNPLSWRRDGQRVYPEQNLGSIKLTHGMFDEDPQPGVTGAQCADGILWIDNPNQDGYDWALFAGGSYHAYDYNLFYLNIRENVRQRAQAFMRRE